MGTRIIGWCLGLALFAALAGGAAEAKQKNFTLVADPPDARIRLTYGQGTREQVYTSPARMSVSLPDDEEAKKKIAIEITREGFQPKLVRVQDVIGGQTVKVTLEKLRMRLKFQLVSPERSNELRIKNNNVTITLRISEQQMEMSLGNKNSRPVKVLWQLASYQDIDNQVHRLMHGGIAFQERNRVLPFQEVLPYKTLNQLIFPVDSVKYNVHKKQYEPAPLFPLHNPARFSGKTIDLAIPVDINGDVVPFRFKIKVDVVQG